MTIKQWIGLIVVSLGLAACQAAQYPPPSDVAVAAPVPVERVPKVSAPIVQAEPKAPATMQSPTPLAPRDTPRNADELRMFVFTEPGGGQQAETREGYEIRFSLFSDYAESKD